MPVYRLNRLLQFPPPELAEESGLLAVGGDLSSKRLLLAYCNGIFPWYGAEGPILWWSPDPRMVLRPAEYRISRRLRKFLKQRPFTYTVDQSFRDVMQFCATVGDRQGNTWIIPAMIEAYSRLHHEGFAHSVEVWREGELVGGVYGVAIGRVFFAESMFSRATNASKAALAVLCERLLEWGYELIDCQNPTTHLKSLGAVEMERAEFLKRVGELVMQEPSASAWRPHASRD